MKPGTVFFSKENAGSGCVTRKMQKQTTVRKRRVVCFISSRCVNFYFFFLLNTRNRITMSAATIATASGMIGEVSPVLAAFV